MSDFRNQMERQGNKLVNRFSLPPLPFHYYEGDKSLINAWKDFVGNEHKNISVRADLTFKKSRRIFFPSIGCHESYSQVHKITEGDAIANITFFCDRINYASYKHAYKRYGKKIDIISCIEGGRKQLREKTPNRDEIKELHAHLLLERPEHISFEEFKVLIKSIWIDTQWGNTQHYIKPIRNLYASAKYNVKSSLDSLDLTNTLLNTKV